MDATTAEKLRVALDADDDSIERALAELDRKASAWFDSVRAAHQALCALAGPRVSSEEAKIQSTPSTLLEEDAAALPAETPTPDSVREELQTALAAPELDAVPAVASADDAAAGREDEDLLAKHNIVRISAKNKDRTHASPKAHTTAEPQGDDGIDALLATLEPEVAQKVRIMHRMFPDKDIEELIERFRTEAAGERNRPAEKEADKGKGWSWWRRDKR